jgi:hypothetical protein
MTIDNERTDKWCCLVCRTPPANVRPYPRPVCPTCGTKMDHPPPVKSLIVWDDLSYVVRWWGSDYHIDFDVLYINGRDATEHVNGAVTPVQTEGLPDGLFVELRDALNGTDTADTLDDAEVYVHGTIKWDGCSHLSFPSTATCMMHLCGLKSWLDFANLIARLPKTLGPMVPKWDVEIAT